MTETMRKNKDMNGIDITTPDENTKFQVKISSFADDTQLFFKDLKLMKTAFTTLQTYGEASEA